jgi:copper(I)-binding protein
MGTRAWILTGLTAMAGMAMLAAGCGSSGHDASTAVAARSGAIAIVDPFIPVPTSSVGAFYVTLRNSGAADALVGGSSPVAASASLHTETEALGGAEVMADLPQLTLPAHGQAGLLPGHDHLMLIGLNRTLSAGQRVAVTLRFAHADPVTIEVPVVPLSQVADGMAGESGSMANMNMAGA